VAQASQPGLQSSNEQWGSYSALTDAAVHWCCITAHLYEEQISISVTAVAQACCQPGLQSSTEQWGSYLALTRPAVHCYCINVHLFEKQISMGVIAVAQASCQLGLQSSTEQWGSYLALRFGVASLHTCIKSKSP